jgi:SM-20-related protein
MWLNQEQTIDSAIRAYRQSLLHSSPNHIVIDNLFDTVKLDEVMAILHQTTGWQTQLHTNSALYVDDAEWQNT